jgi:hypothetical protein
LRFMVDIAWSGIKMMQTMNETQLAYSKIINKTKMINF